MTKNTNTASIRLEKSPSALVYKCRTEISGEHRYLDSRFFLNMYGESFFKPGGGYAENPYLSPVLSAMPGIFDDFFASPLPFPPYRMPAVTATQEKIIGCVDRKYISSPRDSGFSPCRLNTECSDGSFFILGDEIMLSYSAGCLNTICIKGEESFSTALSFSPLEKISFLNGSRLLQTIEYPPAYLRGDRSEEAESFFIECAVTTKRISLAVIDSMSFSAELEYFIEIGTAKCEESKIKIKVSGISEYSNKQ